MHETKCNRCGAVLRSSTAKCTCTTQKSTANKPTNFTKNIKPSEFDLRKGF